MSSTRNLNTIDDYRVKKQESIKLNSYMAKKCIMMDVLMPLISKGSENEGYEGAIVLEPKCNLYLNKSIACLDYGSLYPSSIISENFCMSSLVYSMEYDVNNNLKKVIGYKNKDGTFKCYPLKGSVGDFLYHPDIEKDILESASMFELTEKKEVKKVMGNG